MLSNIVGTTLQVQGNTLSVTALSVLHYVKHFSYEWQFNI